MPTSLNIIWADGGKAPERIASIRTFLQQMVNRLVVGRLRYGVTNQSHLYLTRLEKEVKAYQRTGNAEHLLNAANYCYLESQAPEHPKFHHDATVRSVARKVGKTKASDEV